MYAVCYNFRAGACGFEMNVNNVPSLLTPKRSSSSITPWCKERKYIYITIMSIHYVMNLCCLILPIYKGFICEENYRKLS